MRDTCESTPPTDDSLNSAVDAAFGVKRSPHGSLLRQLQSCAVQKRMRGAELLLTELVLTKFPQLIDAMDCNPLAFTQLVVGGDTKAILDRDKRHICKMTTNQVMESCVFCRKRR